MYFSLVLASAINIKLTNEMSITTRLEFDENDHFGELLISSRCQNHQHHPM